MLLQAVTVLSLQKCQFCRKYRSKAHMSRHIKVSKGATQIMRIFSLGPRRCTQIDFPVVKQTRSRKRVSWWLPSRSTNVTVLAAKPFPGKNTWMIIENLRTANSIKSSQFCEKPFVEESSYVNHIVYCRCPKQFNCNMCKTYFSKQKELIIHTCLMEIEWILYFIYWTNKYYVCSNLNQLLVNCIAQSSLENPSKNMLHYRVSE